MVEHNVKKMKTESDRLEELNKRRCSWTIWIMLVIVCIVFINMIIFVKLFKKRKLWNGLFFSSLETSSVKEIWDNFSVGQNLNNLLDYFLVFEQFGLIWVEKDDYGLETTNKNEFVLFQLLLRLRSKVDLEPTRLYQIISHSFLEWGSAL